MKRDITYAVTAEIFSRFPEYTRALVVARGLTNGPTSPGLAKLMREEEQSIRARVSINTISEDPRFKPWRDAFSWFGAKPSDFRSSVEALTRRVLHGRQLPEISNLVDIGTTICLRHLVPVGGHALDDVHSDISLRQANGDELFMPFGSNISEHPLPGEVILVEGSSILTRRWVWRQANHTLITPATRTAVYNIDILRESSPSEIAVMCDDLATLLREYCRGHVSVSYLSAEAPSVRLSLDDTI